MQTVFFCLMPQQIKYKMENQKSKFKVPELPLV